jgi:hypothetical protein
MWPTALLGQPRAAWPVTARHYARAHTGAVTALRARVMARLAAVLPWRRWSKERRSSTHGGEATRRASGWRRQLTEASCRWEGWKNRDGGGVLQRGGGSIGRRGPVSGWGGRGSSGSSAPGEKAARGVLGAPLTLEEFATAEAAGQRLWRARTVTRHSDSDVVYFGHGRRRGRDGRA